MRRILFLAHRIPYPPNKGEKIRAWHMLRHMAQRDEVYLGAFVDDPDDLQHADALRSICAGVKLVPLDPRMAKLRSLKGLLTGDALTFGYFQSAELAGWAAEVQRHVPIDLRFAYCSAVAPLLPPPGVGGAAPTVVDLVDVDSAKWADYARTGRGPMRWVHGREAVKMAAAEDRIARSADFSLLATEAECDLLRARVPDAAARIQAVENGVDTVRFAPDDTRPNPYRRGGPVLIFTGVMDYRPNVDAVTWFADEIFPRLRERHPGLRFCIAGSRPAPSVKALGTRPGIIVTGFQNDLRPFLSHAAVAVAPLRVARGIQNKVLEAMSMGMPVVASPEAHTGIPARPGDSLLVARDAADWVASLDGLLRDPARRAQLGAQARRFAVEQASWDAKLARLDAILDAVTGVQPATAQLAEAV